MNIFPSAKPTSVVVVHVVATAPTTMLYHTFCAAVFNLIINYPMIIITPRNQYRRNAQSSNRITGHYSPESTVYHIFLG